MARPHPVLLDLAADQLREGTPLPGAVLQSATEHRMSGLVWHAFRSGRFAADDRFRKVAAEGRISMRARNMRLWDEYADVAARFAAVGVEVAVFKGIAIDWLYYPEPASRPAADLDLVIDPACLDRLPDAVAALKPDHRILPHLADLVGRDQVQSIDVKRPSGVWVDIHVDPVKTGIALRTRAEVWERTAVHDGRDGRPLRTLHPSDALVQAVVHQVKDRFSLLRGHADIARIVQSGDVDWDVVAAMVDRDGLAGVFWPALSIVLDDLHMHSLVAPPATVGTYWFDRVWPASTRLQGSTGMAHKVRAKHAIPFFMRGRRREAIRNYWRVLFPPRKLFAYNHPGYRGPYVWRLFRMRTRFARRRHDRNKLNRELGSEGRWGT